MRGTVSRKSLAVSIICVVAAVCACLICVYHGSARRTELISQGRLTAVKGVLHEAHNAHVTIASMINQLKTSTHPSAWQKTLLSQATKTLDAVQKLEIASPSGNEVSSSSDANDSTTIDMKLSSQLPLKDDVAVRDELNKLKETAERVSAEMKKMKDDDAADTIRRASMQVERDNSSMQRAHEDESAARRRVVAHELAVQREKLAEAEAEEHAAARAAAEAQSAEELAMEKHREAARDERDAAARRLAARRAHAIAAVGAGDVLGLDKFAAEHSLSSTDSSGVAPPWLARECTDAISQLGCSHLPVGSTCMRFCAGVETKPAAARRQSSQAISSTSYVDTVYGTPYTPEVDTTDAVSQHFQRVAYGRALARLRYSRGGDIASNGHDFEQVAKVQAYNLAGGILAREKQLETRLSSALTNANKENQALRERVRSQGDALRMYKGFGGSRQAMPPLPRYKQVLGSQKLAEMTKRIAQEQIVNVAPRDLVKAQANELGSQVHDAVSSESSVFDPFRP